MLAISVDSGRHVSLSLSHQGSGFERFGRAQGQCDRMSSGIFPDGLEGWRRPKAKNKATEDPFLVQRTDNICLQLEPSSGARRLTESPEPTWPPRASHAPPGLCRNWEGVCYLWESRQYLLSPQTSEGAQDTVPHYGGVSARLRGGQLSPWFLSP